MTNPVIRFHLYEPPILTVEQYEELEREVTARIMAGDVTRCERILARMLKDNRSRYLECKNAIQTNDRHGTADGPV
jgi:hypothetical protein